MSLMMSLNVLYVSVLLPGLFFILPCTDSYTKVDLRTVSFDVPPQEVCACVCGKAQTTLVSICCGLLWICCTTNNPRQIETTGVGA